MHWKIFSKLAHRLSSQSVWPSQTGLSLTVNEKANTKETPVTKKTLKTDELIEKPLACIKMLR